MGDQIAELYAKIGADVKSFESGMKSVKTGMQQADTEVKKTKGTIQGLNDTIKMVGATMVAAGVVKAGQYALELDKLGRASLRLGREFENLADQHKLSSKGIITALQEASGHTVNNMDLMLEANRALKYGLVESEEGFKELMLAARFYGRQMGVSTLEAYQRMVNGIGKGSRQIIDDLGITGIAFEQGGDKAQLMADVVGNAMREIEASGGLLDDEADKTARLAASVDNLQEKWGVLVAKSGVVDLVVNVTTHGVESWSQMMDDVKVIDAWAAEHDTKTIDVVMRYVIFGDAGIAEKDKWVPGSRSISEQGKTIAGLAEQYGGVANQASAAWAGLADQLDATGRAAKGLPDDYQMPGWTQGADDYDNASGFSQKSAIEAKNFLIKSDRELAEERKKNSEKYWKDYTAKGEEALGKIKALIGGAYTSAEDWIRVALQGTSADVGDAWDEMARRAEAVINDMFDAEGKQIAGATSPWLAMFDIPQDVLARGGDTLKAYMTQLAADIRDSPTVQELGSVGIDAMVVNIKKELADQIGKADLEQTIALKLASDPEAVSLMEQLGIDVSAAVGALQDPIVTSIEELKTATLSTDVQNLPDMLTEQTATDKLDAVKTELSSIATGTMKVEITNFGDIKPQMLFSFADGGVVPGRPEQAQLAMVHGGEVITPAAQLQHNYNLTVNTPMSGAFVIREFNMMRSLAGA